MRSKAWCAAWVVAFPPIGILFPRCCLRPRRKQQVSLAVGNKNWLPPVRSTGFCSSKQSISLVFFSTDSPASSAQNSADFNGQRPSQMNSCVGRMQRDNKRGEISLEFSRNGRVDQLNETREFNQPRDELLVVLRSTPRDNKFFFVVAAEGEKTWPQTCAKVYSCCWRKGNNKQQQPQQQQPSNKMASARRSLFPSTAV